jgi:HMG (high mobility group) box
MGALQVMQEVGKKWQAMTSEERHYFKQKADTDKMRYLTEQRAFYDEVEKIGKNVGTVTTKEGKIIVAPPVGQEAPA